MLTYIIRRIFYMIPTVIAISVVAFLVINLPPGDFSDVIVSQRLSMGEDIDRIEIDNLIERYGLDQPVHIQYWRWVSGIVTRGDFGRSFMFNAPVTDLIWGRIGLTFMLSLSTTLFIWLFAIPIGIYSALKQYSFNDYIVTIIGFLGLATPNFLLALIFLWISFSVFGQTVGGLFSPEFVDAGWSIAKFLDLLAHLWVPVIILGTAGTASLIRQMRANLLDELRKPYVAAARSKGLRERTVVWRYPVRIALNFFVSAQANILVSLVSGATIVSVVLSLPTTGPLLLRALTAQDMYLAGTFILLLSVLNVVSTLISDIALAALDPRVRYTK